MRNPKVIVLLLLVIAALADGVAHQLTSPREILGPSDIAFMFVATFLTFLWYRFDSDQIAYRRTPWLNVSVIAISLLALPYYFFRSRGFARGGIAVGLFFGCCALYALLQHAGELVAYHAWQN
jgi:hypothetical protein